MLVNKSSTVTIPEVNSTNSSSIVHVHTGSNLHATILNGNDIGVGIQISPGSTVEVDSLALHDSNVGISQSGTANVIFHSVEFSGTNGIGIDWSSVNGADIANVTVDSQSSLGTILRSVDLIQVLFKTSLHLVILLILLRSILMFQVH